MPDTGMDPLRGCKGVTRPLLHPTVSWGTRTGRAGAAQGLRALLAELPVSSRDGAGSWLHHPSQGATLAPMGAGFCGTQQGFACWRVSPDTSTPWQQGRGDGAGPGPAGSPAVGKHLLLLCQAPAEPSPGPVPRQCWVTAPHRPTCAPETYLHPLQPAGCPQGLGRP